MRRVRGAHWSLWAAPRPGPRVLGLGSGLVGERTSKKGAPELWTALQCNVPAARNVSQCHDPQVRRRCGARGIRGGRCAWCEVCMRRGKHVRHVNGWEGPLMAQHVDPPSASLHASVSATLEAGENAYAPDDCHIISMWITLSDGNHIVECMHARGRPQAA